MIPPALVEEIADLLCAAVGEDPAWRAALTPHTRLDGDLFLDSIEIAALAAALRERYGARVDLAAHVADLELDPLIELTLAQVAEYVAERVGSGVGEKAGQS
ncbi:phosphopantetheine-binding protein [Actinospica robiniae]|uniref:phosphopantetheine-binding protein n=1 Tax=Actinospica robiniae TaxID=304901 RepID=UPI000425E29D|nr:phosphopantetheine-binding protein [Actinospica robiniae]